MFIKYHESTFTFQISHKIGNRKFWGYQDKHMNMVWHHVSLNDFHHTKRMKKKTFSESENHNQRSIKVVH